MVSPLYEREQAVLAATQRLRFFPLTVVAGEGCWLVEEGGRRLLDLSASWAIASLGYGHPAIQAAVARAMSQMAGVGLVSTCNVEAVQLAEALLACTPGTGERRVYLGHSGSDANEAAVRTIRHSTGRSGVIAFHGSYHGGLAGSSQFSGLIVDAGGHPDSDLSLLPYPSGPSAAETARAALDQLDTLLDQQGENIAALICEPLMSDGGVIVPPPGFLADVHKRLSSAGVLLICDEVKVGLGRTGTLHAFEHDGITPDVVTFGKSLGGGLPVSAVVGPAHVFDTAEAFTMLGTAGNPVTAAAAHAVLRTVIDENLPAEAAARGAQLRAGLTQLKSEHPAIEDIRGRGLSLGMQLGTTCDGRNSPSSTAAKVCYRAWELGLVLYPVGPDADILEMTPPLIISPAEVDQALALLAQALTDVEMGAVSDETVSRFQGW
ncbi:aspartate aminotransferase family protein [Amycolatopsis sp. GM8]|uniref:aspartate aminotransferase family protein n=1 Tax=Amycolatopsis sp. GM8 TaxID=2896530 RepID=UPI001F25D97E|nr:aspartate aminotransferase family protein [Amycolatopsis sp. GM8]